MAATVKFKITGGEVVPEIEMLASATIFDLKKKIESILEVGVSRQTLRFNNQVLTNERKIERYNFSQSATLVLLVAPLPGHPRLKICVKSPYELSSNIRVKETTLVADLKKEISDRWIVAAKSMTLYRLSTKMEEDLPVSDYYVCEGSKIEVRYNFHSN
ncbi:Ubiquitin domain-containing protein [Melia azedarach]|uniref:Ubiquitin domain-containing protein n=1 Tax=Melia azedarach TaxID=155640 RepID=A0ACC1YME6_MELAZ|nr:Ubiquitin domain-containing protein [Melia azedarach]